MNRKRARYIAGILRRGPTEAGYAFFRARRRRRNLIDDEPELLEGDRLALTPEVAALDAATLERHRALVAAQLAGGEREVRTVLWLFPFFHLVWGGGIATLLRIADHLTREHGVRHVFHVHNRDDDAVVAEMARKAAAAWPALSGATWQPAATPLPDADVVLATTWDSLPALVALDHIPAKAAVVQDWEPDFEPAGSARALLGELASLGTPGIVNTPGLADAWRAAGSPAVSFTPAVDTARFRPAEADPAGPVRIVFYGRPGVARNAFGVGLAALREVKRRLGPGVEIVCAGEDWSPGQYGMADVLTNVGALESLDAVADLYRSSQIGLGFMLTRHPSYQPLEWMASGVATVTNHNPATAWLLRDGENAILTRPLPALVADAVVGLVEDPALRARIVAGGRATVAALDWEPELDRVWQALTQRGPATFER
jgi:glycosyltransferase involved in cell wall biosynthesis